MNKLEEEEEYCWDNLKRIEVGRVSEEVWRDLLSEEERGLKRFKEIG